MSWRWRRRAHDLCVVRVRPDASCRWPGALDPIGDAVFCLLAAGVLLLAVRRAAVQFPPPIACQNGPRTCEDAHVNHAPFVVANHRRRGRVPARCARRLRRAGGTTQRGRHRGRRPGLFRPGLLRRRDRDAAPRWAGRRRPAVHAVLQHGTVLADARGAAHRLLRAADPPRCVAGHPSGGQATAPARGRSCCPPCSARWAIARITPASGTSMACRCGAASTTRTCSRTRGASSTRTGISRMTRRCRPCSRTAATTRRPRSPTMRSGTSRSTPRARRTEPLLPVPRVHRAALPAACARRTTSRGTGTATARAGTTSRRARWERVRGLGLVGRAVAGRARRRAAVPLSRSAEDARARRSQPAAAVERADGRAARVPGHEDGDPCGDGRPDGPRDRPRAGSAPRDERPRQHADLLPVRQRRQRRDHGPRRWPRPDRRARLGGDAPLPGPGLVHRLQHAVPPAQDLGPRRRHRARRWSCTGRRESPRGANCVTPRAT